MWEYRSTYYDRADVKSAMADLGQGPESRQDAAASDLKTSARRRHCGRYRALPSVPAIRRVIPPAKFRLTRVAGPAVLWSVRAGPSSNGPLPFLVSREGRTVGPYQVWNSPRSARGAPDTRTKGAARL
jgi:hypothetical protein